VGGNEWIYALDRRIDAIHDDEHNQQRYSVERLAAAECNRGK